MLLICYFPGLKYFSFLFEGQADFVTDYQSSHNARYCEVDV